MVLFLLTFFLYSPTSFAANIHHKEKDYQNVWCAQHNGITEYRLDDKARIDCLTEDYAIEFDFAYKWAEAVGQALYYAAKTSKKPGIVIIIEKEKDKRNLKRLEILTDKYNIKLWTMTPSDL
ncbi:MAG: hypothetical protein WA277_13330 [Nitrospirota bacterium]